MNVQATKLQAAENDLKQLMADVARAVEKAQEAVARITPKAVATTTEGVRALARRSRGFRGLRLLAHHEVKVVQGP